MFNTKTLLLLALLPMAACSSVSNDTLVGGSGCALSTGAAPVDPATGNRTTARVLKCDHKVVVADVITAPTLAKELITQAPNVASAVFLGPMFRTPDRTTFTVGGATATGGNPTTTATGTGTGTGGNPTANPVAIGGGGTAFGGMGGTGLGGSVLQVGTGGSNGSGDHGNGHGRKDH